MTNDKPATESMDRSDRWPVIVTPTRGAKAFEEYRSNPIDFLLKHSPEKVRVERARRGE